MKSGKKKIRVKVRKNASKLRWLKVKYRKYRMTKRRGSIGRK